MGVGTPNGLPLSRRAFQRPAPAACYASLLLETLLPHAAQELAFGVRSGFPQPVQGRP